MSNYQSNRRLLVSVIDRLSLKHGGQLEGGKIKLKSGRFSDTYVDMKPTLLNSTGVLLAAECLWDFAFDAFSKVTHVGGPEIGAIPVASVAVMGAALARAPLPLQGFTVRKASKDHGVTGLIAGLPRGETLKNRKVILLEDVTTTGGSTITALKALREQEAIVDTVITMVDREEGGEAALQAEGVQLRALFTFKDFGIKARTWTE